jgi:hypothetical protein
VTSREAAYSGMRSLSEVLEQQRIVRAARAASLAETDGDYLYSIAHDGRVVAHRIGYANRAELERDGETATLAHFTYPEHVVFATREAAEAIAYGDIKQLRRQMADVHPDRGGTAEQFMAARKRYERALRRAS